MKKLLAILIGLAVLVACNNTPSPIAPENDPDTTSIIEAGAADSRVLGETALHNKVVPVTGALLDAVVKVNKNTGEMIFVESSATIAKLEVGNILVGKASIKARRGFLRKITAVQAVAGQLWVKTIAAKLNEVFSAGGFRFKRKMQLADADYLLLPNGQKQSLKRSLATPQGVLFPVNIDFCPVNLDGNKSTTNDQICVSGSVDLSLDFDFVFDCRGVLCTKPYLDTNVTISQTANLTVTGELTRSVNKVVSLGTVVLPIITVPILGIPLVFVPEIDLSATLSGEVSVGFNWSANQEMSYTVGLELEDGKFDTYSTFSKSIKTSSAEVSLAMNAEARVDAEASVLVYGIGGPTATLGGFVTFEAGFPRSPTWTLSAGLDVSIGLELELFGLINQDVNYEIFEKRWTIAEAKNTKPSIIIKTPLENETIELAKQTYTSGALNGQTYYIIPEIDINTDDLEDGFACCSVAWTIAGINQNTALGSGHKFSDYHLIASAGLKTITATVTDSNGSSSTKTWNFTIKECSNTISAFGGLRACALSGGGTLGKSEYKF